MGTKRRTKKVIGVILLVIVCAVLIVGGITIYGRSQMSKIPALTFEEALQYTTKNNPDAVITVGILKDGQVSYKVYGENGQEIPAQPYTYEIGSLTKTFTAALINKAVLAGKMNGNDTIDRYLTLPGGNEYPTIRELLTHTSGYKAYYFESPMIMNRLKGRNDFYGVTKEMVLEKAGDLNMDEEGGGFLYSNYGYAVLGLVLEAVYGTDYTSLLNDFTRNELGLTDTKISDGSGELGNYWEWKDGDAYLPAGAMTSNIFDMLLYAQMQLEDHPYLAGCHESLQVIDASTEAYSMMGIHMDEIGMSWVIDKENGVVWHNGGTGEYNSYLGFHPETGTAVVVLANTAPGYRIPATVLGIKRLLELV